MAFRAEFRVDGWTDSTKFVQSFRREEKEKRKIRQKSMLIIVMEIVRRPSLMLKTFRYFRNGRPFQSQDFTSLREKAYPAR